MSYLLSQFVNIVYEKDALALTSFAWFDDHNWHLPIFALDFRNITFELLHLMWNDPSLGIETEVDRVLIFHLLEATGQICFLGDAAHGREVVHLLERLQLRQLLLQDRHVVPDDVHVRVPGDLIAAGLLCLRDLVVFVATGHCFLFFLLLRGRHFFTISILLLHRRYHFPLHLKRTLAYESVLGVGEVDADLASVEDVVVARPHNTAAALCVATIVLLPSYRCRSLLRGIGWLSRVLLRLIMCHL